jgi:NAD(P)-dependent dehydrogenase (short-subunit alcohol dehydrogenase family)
MAYSASKAAVIGMTKVRGKEVAGTGVTVNALAPAVIETPMVQALPDQQVKYMTDKIPMGRCGSLDELVANGGIYRFSQLQLYYRIHFRPHRRTRNLLIVAVRI